MTQLLKNDLIYLIFGIIDQIWWKDGPRKTFCPFLNKTGMVHNYSAVRLLSNYG